MKPRNLHMPGLRKNCLNGLKEANMGTKTESVPSAQGTVIYDGPVRKKRAKSF